MHYSSRNFEIGNETVKYLIHTLKKLTNLTQLNVRLSVKTRVDEEGEEQFVQAVKEMPSIKKCTWDCKNVL